MKIAIYQINRERDGKRVMFLDYERMKKSQGGIDSGIYDRVFDGEVPCEGLEDVYRIKGARIALQNAYGEGEERGLDRGTQKIPQKSCEKIVQCGKQRNGEADPKNIPRG